MFEDREICVFFGDMCFFQRLQRHTTTTSFFTTLTHSQTQTQSLTHTCLANGGSREVVPEEFFFGFCKLFFDHMWSARVFWARKGVTQHPKIFPECYKCFQLFMFIFFRRHYAAHVSMIRFLTCHVRSHCWK